TLAAIIQRQMNFSNSIDHASKALLDFKRRQTDLWELFEAGFSAVDLIPSELFGSNKRFPDHEFQVLLFWQTCIEYQRESLLLILKGQFDLGLGCLRLAAELTRNSIRILEKPELLDLLREREKPGVKDKLRKALKFYENRPEEKFLYD